MNNDQSTVVTTYKQRDAWSRMVAREPRVKLSHRNVLVSLALCMRVIRKDDKNKDMVGKLICDPTYADLGKASLRGARTAMRAVAGGEEMGIIRKARQSDGRVSNEFELLLPDVGSNSDKNLVFNGAKSAEHSGSNSDKSEPLSDAIIEIVEVPTVPSRWHGHKAKRKEEVSKEESKQ